MYGNADIDSIHLMYSINKPHGLHRGSISKDIPVLNTILVRLT